MRGRAWVPLQQPCAPTGGYRCARRLLSSHRLANFDRLPARMLAQLGASCVARQCNVPRPGARRSNRILPITHAHICMLFPNRHAVCACHLVCAAQRPEAGSGGSNPRHSGGRPTRDVLQPRQVRVLGEQHLGGQPGACLPDWQGRLAHSSLADTAPQVCPGPC